MQTIKLSNHVSWPRQENEVNASFLFLLFGTLTREKQISCKKIVQISNEENLKVIKKIFYN